LIPVTNLLACDLLGQVSLLWKIWSVERDDMIPCTGVCPGQLSYLTCIDVMRIVGQVDMMSVAPSA
jgi:hypothetical protein